MYQQAIRSATPSTSENARKRRFTMSHTERTRQPLQQNSLGKRERDGRNKHPRLSMGATNRQAVGYQRILVERPGEEDAEDNDRDPSLSLPTRRKSTLNRPSFIKPQTSAFESSKTPTATRLHFDPRDIKSSEFQRRAIRAITKYLNDTGFSPITPQSFRSLGNRNFQDIFKFLHRRLVGNPVYMKDKFEDEFINILKSLRYPLADTISPRSLYSIAAPHSYPSFLALLLWMTEMCQVYDQYMEIDDEQADENMGEDEFEADEMNQLFFDYTVATYNAFMEGADEFTAIDQQLISYLDEMNERFANELKVKLKEIQQLEQELRRISTRSSAVPALQSKRKEMENDMVKFAAYCEDKERRIAKYIELNRKVTDQIKMLDTQLKTAEAEKEGLQVRLKAQQISETEMDALSEEQISLEREFNALQSRVDELGRSIATREADIEQLTYAIEDKAASYASFRDGLPPDIPEFAFNGDPEATATANFRARAMEVLSSLDAEYMEQVQQMNQQFSEAKLQFEQLSRTYSEQKTELTTLEMKLERRRRELEDQKKAISLEMEKYNHDTEQTERKFTEMKSNARSQLIYNQQKESQLKVTLNSLRQDLVAQKREISHNMSMLISELGETIRSTESRASKLCENFKERAQRADTLFVDPA